MAKSSTLATYSPVSSAEIWRGARGTEADAISKLFAALVCIPTDATIGKRAGKYLARFGNALIAATASVHRLRLWTRNKKHFPCAMCIISEQITIQILVHHRR